MTFEPKPGERINIGKETIEFISLESSGPAKVFVYAEAGKEGIIYKVMKGGEYYALKVFYPDYQDERLLKNTEKLTQYKHLEGFRVAERIVINRKSYPDLVNEYPELNYSVLMPWIQGTVWGNLMVNDFPLRQEKYLQIAQELIKAVHNLEAQGLAHCDLSNNNFIIDPTQSTIELIDIEDMYAPEMPRPIPDISYGTPGYRTKWIAENGLWGPKSDRFASAILCSEIISWHVKEIRDSKVGDTSFFDESEIGEDSERYRIMKTYLSKMSEELSALFEKAWFSETLDQCPPVFDWLNHVELIGTTRGTVRADSAYIESKQEVLGGAELTKDLTITSGIPPKMELSHTMLDFGVLQQSNNVIHMTIANTGGSVLTGNFITSPWLETSPSHFSIRSGDKEEIAVSINKGYPKTQGASEYRSPNAMVIESNAGVEVIGARYKFLKSPFYKSWLGWPIIAIGVFLLCGILSQINIETKSLFPLSFSNTLIMTSTNTTVPTKTATLIPTRASIPIKTATRIPTRQPSTPTPSCYEWNDITDAMLGDVVCVYGEVFKQDILSYGGSRIYFDQNRTFFFVSSDYYFPNLKKGDCVVGEGKVELSSVKILYINIIKSLYIC